MVHVPPTLTGNEEAVMLFTAENNNGKPFYAYIKLTLIELAKFYEKQDKGEPVDLNRIGQVLETGWGHEPAAEVHQRIIDEYGPTLK